MTPVRVHSYDRLLKPPRFPAFHTVTGEEPFWKLMSRKELDRLCDMPEESKLFGIDRLLDDDKYVFLSVGEPARGIGESKSTCFMFDTEKLIQMGALIREQDIISTREWNSFDTAVDEAQRKLFSRFRKLNARDNVHLTRSERKELSDLEDVLGDEFEYQEQATLEMTPEQLSYYIDNDSAVQEAWTDLKAKHRSMTHRGKDAIDALSTCEGCELLIPKELPVAKALFVGRVEEIRDLLRRRAAWGQS